jgi:hypothetical protein
VCICSWRRSATRGGATCGPSGTNARREELEHAPGRRLPRNWSLSDP